MGALLLAAVLSRAGSKAELARIHEKLRSTSIVIEGFGHTTTSTYEGEIRLAGGNKARRSTSATARAAGPT